MKYDYKNLPLVSVGVPTFNRADTLQRAVESVLTQDYSNVEVIVSDDASMDGTQAWCEGVARHDRRVRYIRQPTNIGLTENYAEVFRQSRGEFYLALADDDWLDSSYVSQCLKVLLEQPGLALVCGKLRMFQNGQYLYDGHVDSALQRSGGDRVVYYLRRVVENAELHGLMRRTTVMAVPPMPNGFAGDWRYVSSLVFHGKSRTLTSVAINKALGGVSSSWSGQAKAYGLSSRLATLRGFPYLVITADIFKDIAWRSPVYGSLNHAARFVLACRATTALSIHFALLNGG